MQASNPDAGSAGRRMLAIALLRRPLMYELAVDGSKDALLPLAESWVGLSRLRDGHHRLRRARFGRGIAQVPSERIRGQAQHPLKVGDPSRPRRGLAGEPLRDRGLGDPQCGGKLALGEPALGAGALERPSEVHPLIRRRHVPVLSEASAFAIKHA